MAAGRRRPRRRLRRGLDPRVPGAVRPGRVGAGAGAGPGSWPASWGWWGGGAEGRHSRVAAGRTSAGKRFHGRKSPPETPSWARQTVP